MKLEAVFYLILASFSFGLSPVVVRHLINLGVNSIEIILAQALLLAPLMFFYLMLRRNKIKQIPKENWKELIVIGFFATFIGSGGLIYAQQFTSAINVAFLMKLSVVFVPIIAFFMLREVHSNWKYGVMLLSLVGAFLLTTGGKLIAPKLGDIYVIGISAVLSYTNVLAKKASHKVDAFLISGIRLFIGNLLFLFFIPLYGIGFTYLFIDYLPSILILGGCYLGTAFFLYKGIELSSASEGTALFLLSAPFAFILSSVFLQETLTAIQFSGAAIILVSCYLIRK